MFLKSLVALAASLATLGAFASTVLVMAGSSSGLVA